MTLQQLRYIIALADIRHFARAAEACHVSQSTLSIQLKKLEDSLGVTLFDRSLKRVTPTPLGREIVDQARAMLHQADHIRELAHSQPKDPMDQTLRLGVIPTVAPYLLPRVLPMVHRVHPRLRLLLREVTTDDLLADLRAGRVDAALLSLPVPAMGLKVMSGYHECFFAAVPVNSPLAKHKDVSLDALAKGHLLLLEEGHCLRDQALAVCGGQQPHNEEVKATSLEMLRQMVAGGIGCTLLPGLAVRLAESGDDPRVALRPLKAPVPKRRIALLWRTRSTLQATLLRLADTLVAYLPEGVVPISN